MAYERLNLATGDLLDQDVFKHLEDGIEALDLALDSKVVDVEKTHYGTNRFDKESIPFVKNFYISNNIGTDKIFFTQTNTTSGAGGGWKNIPVESGKTYTISVRNPVTLPNNNGTYGVFISIFFMDSAGMVVSSIGGTTGNGYYYSIGGNTANVSEVNYSASKVTSKAYTGGSNGARGLFTSAMTINIIDESICFMHVQIGSQKFGQYQINADFCSNGYLTDEQITQLHDSFQINEGTELLEYEDYGDYNYIEQVVESNLTKLQSAFTTMKVNSTNLFDPVNYVSNHTYITNGALQSGRPPKGTYGRSALLEIPLDEPGKYVLHCNKLFEFGNKKFGYFGKCIFTDIDDVIITTEYAHNAGDITIGIDTSKVELSGSGGSTTVKFNIIDENIKKLYIALLDSDKNQYGLWTNYEYDGGLSDDELLELTTMIQLNKGSKVLPYKSFYDVAYKSVIGPENIHGLDTFMEDINAKIEETVSNIKIKEDEKNCSCIIQDNNIFVRAKQYTQTNDFVWSLAKINQSGGNKYFNISSMNTCLKTVLDEEVPDSLTVWKGCADDICPPNIMGTYIAANHGYNCVDRITASQHGKTEKDLGSIWNDSSNKTYVLTHIYDADTLGFVMFNSSNMVSGKMGYGSPAVGTVMTHESGATNINDVSIESRTSTQLWQCYNHYGIKLFVDGREEDIHTDQILQGEKIEIFTQYDVIFVPAMLQYLMDNVGNNTSLSQNSDDINDSYMTMYINYQFNKNGSVSTYSSFYINKDITVGYIGLVQSQPIGSTAYTYIPDTSYKVLTLNDGSASQSFNKDCWDSEDKCPYRFFQFNSTEAAKGMSLIYDRTIGWGKNDIRKEHLTYAGMYYTSKKMYPAFIAGGSLPKGTYFDGMAARVPLYKYDPDLTSVGWYWSSDDIHLMIDTHNSVNKDIVLPDYMNNMRIEILDKTDSVTCNQTYIFNNKLRFISSEYGYLVLRLYK